MNATIKPGDEVKVKSPNGRFCQAGTVTKVLEGGRFEMVNACGYRTVERVARILPASTKVGKLPARNDGDRALDAMLQAWVDEPGEPGE